MKEFFYQCKKVFAGPDKSNTRDAAGVLKHVDAQIGRAVTRLSER